MKKYLLILSLLHLFAGVSYADETEIHYVNEANKLNEAKLFLGTDLGYELDRAPSRVEALTLLIRLLGLEEEVKDLEGNHNFNDVPNWANNYIEYATTHNLTNGISETEFGSNQLATEDQFLTFVLRALGYDDSKGDFYWKESKNMSIEIGLLKEDYLSRDRSVFLRDDAVGISYNALFTSKKNSEEMLLDDLIEKGAVESSIFLEPEERSVNSEKVNTLDIDLFDYLGRNVYEVEDELHGLYGLYGDSVSLWVTDLEEGLAYISIRNNMNQEVSLTARGNSLSIVKASIGFNSYGFEEYGVIVENRAENINGYQVNKGTEFLLGQIGITYADFTSTRSITNEFGTFKVIQYAWEVDNYCYTVEIFDDYSRIFGISTSFPPSEW